MIAETVPAEVSFAALEESAAREKQLASSGRELGATLRRIKEERGREIRAVIPADKLEAYTKIQERAKLRFTEVTNVKRHTTESLNLTAQMRKQILRETKDALAQLGVDGRKIEQIQKKYSAQARSAVEDAFDLSADAPYVEAGPPPISTGLDAFERITSPYAGQGGGQFAEGTAGSRSATHSEDFRTGFVKCSTGTNLDHAGDNDYNVASARSEMHFWFRMPSSGLIEVVPTLQALNSDYGGYLWDEWGYSDADVYMFSSAYLKVISPLATRDRLATLLSIQKRRNDEGEWSGSVAAPGEFRYPRLFSQDVYLANQWVECAVGIIDGHYSRLDTMSSATHISSEWFIKEILVRSTGSLRND